MRAYAHHSHTIVFSTNAMPSGGRRSFVSHSSATSVPLAPIRRPVCRCVRRLSECELNCFLFLLVGSCTNGDCVRSCARQTQTHTCTSQPERFGFELEKFEAWPIQFNSMILLHTHSHWRCWQREPVSPAQHNRMPHTYQRRCMRCVKWYGCHLLVHWFIQ